MNEDPISSHSTIRMDVRQSALKSKGQCELLCVTGIQKHFCQSFLNIAKFLAKYQSLRLSIDRFVGYGCLSFGAEVCDS